MNREITVKMKNRQAVKDFFINEKSGVKSGIAKATRLSQASVTTILHELMEEKFIEYVDDCQSTGGRKAKRYELKESYATFGLIHLHVADKQVLINLQVRNIAGGIVYTESFSRKKLAFDLLKKEIAHLVETYGISYLSLSFPGIIDNGKVTKSDIPAFENVNLKSKLDAVFDINIIIENDVNCAMLGFVHEKDVTNSSVAFVYQPDNHHSGCGLYLNGQVVYGATNFAGELAYLPNGNLDEQVAELENDPALLLVKQVQSLIAIVNPAQIALSTFSLNEEELEEMLLERIPRKHWPQFIFIEEMIGYIYQGLFAICIGKTRFK